jgi:hypothetical protein
MSFPTAWKLFTVTMELSSGMPLSISFVLSMVLNNSSPPRVFLNKMESWNERTALYLRWLGRYSMSIWLLCAFGPMLLALLSIFQIESFCARFCIWLHLSFALVVSLLSLILGRLDANALFWNMAILISFSLALLMAFCLDTPLIVDLTEFTTLRLTPLLSHVMWPSTRLLLILMMFFSVQVTRKWRRASL